MFVETHIRWLQSHGIQIKPLDHTNPNGRGPLDPHLLQSLPPDLAEWYKARLCDRVDGLDCLAFDSVDGYVHDFTDPMEQISGLYMMFDKPWEPGERRIEYYRGLPILFCGDLQRPLPIASWDYGSIVAETAGERTGWLYAFDEYGDGCGPFMRSLPDYLACVRALVDNNHLVLGPDYAAWSSAYGAKQPPLAGPPADTPGAFILDPGSESFADRLVAAGPYAPIPAQGSITDLVPGLQLRPPLPYTEPEPKARY